MRIEINADMDDNIMPTKLVITNDDYDNKNFVDLFTVSRDKEKDEDIYGPAFSVDVEDLHIAIEAILKNKNKSQ